MLKQAHITIKELVPIVLGAAVWGREWYGRTVQVWCDNSAVVAILNWGNSQDPEAMHLMRCLAFIKAKFQFALFATHIKGTNNDLADALSRKLFPLSPPAGSPRSNFPPAGAVGPDDDIKAGLDISSLDRSVECYFRSGLAPSTHQSYESAKRRFLQFCKQANFNPLPLNENLRCRYVAYLAEEGLSPRTIKPYLSAVRHLQVAMNLPDPKIGEMARLEQVLKGAKREYVKKNPDKRERLPITPDLLIKMKSIWSKDPSKFDNIMIWAACCLCYFGFLRSGEVTVPSEAAYDSGAHLNMADVSVDSIEDPSVVKVRIKASKTDQFRRGVDIYVGRTHNQLCPVEALMTYVARRGKQQGPFF